MNTQLQLPEGKKAVRENEDWSWVQPYEREHTTLTIISENHVQIGWIIVIIAFGQTNLWLAQEINIVIHL